MEVIVIFCTLLDARLCHASYSEPKRRQAVDVVVAVPLPEVVQASWQPPPIPFSGVSISTLL